MDQILLKLNKDIAQELDIPEQMVQHVINYIFNDVRRHIKEGIPQPILIHNFGSFYLSKQSVPKFKEKLELSFERGKIKKHIYNKILKNLEMIEKRNADSNK